MAARQAGAASAATTAPRSQRAGAPATVRDHIDAADDIVDSLLDWRHVTIGQVGQGTPSQSTTLVSADAAKVQRLQSVLTALGIAVPAASSATSESRGDLRAHIEKARETAKELGASGANAGSATGHNDNGLVTFDRTALERLEVEIDAMQLLDDLIAIDLTRLGGPTKWKHEAHPLRPRAF